MNNNNKRGLSTIVATLLIILLTLVAVGIIWVVVRNVVQGGTDQMAIDAKCIQASVLSTNVVNTSTGSFVNNTYNITLSREGGDEEIGGVELVFTDAAETSSFIWTRVGNIASLGTVVEKVSIPITGTDALANPSKVSVVVYFLDSSGDKQYCTTSNPREF